MTLATAGLARAVAPLLEPVAARVVPEAVVALPAPVELTLANGLAGTSLGAATQASITEAEKIARIGDIFAKAHPSGTGPRAPYEYYYGVRDPFTDELEAFWNAVVGR